MQKVVNGESGSHDQQRKGTFHLQFSLSLGERIGSGFVEKWS